VTTWTKGPPQYRVCEGSGQIAQLFSSATSVATVLGQCSVCSRSLVCGGILAPLHSRPLLACEMEEETT